MPYNIYILVKNSIYASFTLALCSLCLIWFKMCRINKKNWYDYNIYFPLLLSDYITSTRERNGKTGFLFYILLVSMLVSVALFIVILYNRLIGGVIYMNGQIINI